VIRPGAVIIVHLVSPTEKFWGVLDRLDAVGLFLRGLNVSSFDDFLSQAASGEPLTLGMATMFVPMQRVERIFLDEQVGAVESYSQRFERRVGIPITAFLDVGDPDDPDDPDGLEGMGPPS